MSMYTVPSIKRRISQPMCKRQRGAVFIELVIVMVFFVFPIFMGVIEIGRLIYTYKTVVHQVHHTARYLSLQMPGSNYDVATCLFKTARPTSTCLADDALSVEFNDAQISISRQEISVGNAVYPNYANAVTFKVENFPYNFIFSDLLNIPSIIFSPISSTYRQVN